MIVVLLKIANQVIDDRDFGFIQGGYVNRIVGWQIQQIVCRNPKKLSQFYDECGRGDGDAHFPGIDAASGDV